MSRLRQTLAALVAGTLIGTTGLMAVAQDASTPDSALRAQMAAITLDSSALPGGYLFVGEAFLSAEQAVTGDVAADDLGGAGFVTQYVSTYRNSDTGYEISSYVSAWTDAAAAESGFAIIEDEATSHPGATLADTESPVGETPGETTTGSYPDSEDETISVNTNDVTFRVDRFLVGVSLNTFDGTVADAATVGTLAGTLEGRATAAIGGDNPDGTDLALVPQALPLFDLGTDLQSGFLGRADVEQMYGLRGSALSGLDASWSEAVGLGEGEALQPYLSVGLTTFGKEEDAASVVEQIDDLAPQVAGTEKIDGVEVEGADTVVAYSFPSLATGAAEADSVRIVAVTGTALVVIDVQGAPSADIAQETAVALATAQVGCIGATSCATPELPADLGGA